MLMLAPAFVANAITYTYGEFNRSAKTCTLLSWGGQQPTSGKLVLKETFEQDGVTYKVTSIGAHALDNLTEVTEITIPANVKAIGMAHDSDLASCQNFNNCPKLKTFKVAAGSESFNASGAGILMRKGENIIVRVPEGIEVTDGTLKMSKNTIDICPDAFAGNSTISVLYLSPVLFEFSSNCGFNDMKLLREFRVNGVEGETGQDYLIKDGILYDRTGKKIISYPPARTDAFYTIQPDVEVVGEYAFANTFCLSGVDFAQVQRLDERAFHNSGLTSLELPNRPMELERGVFGYSQKLTELSIPYTMSLPEDFVRNSYHLKKVFVNSSSTTYGDCAFKQCVSLDTFNFRPDMEFEGDSIFAGCGFKEVSFATGAVPVTGCTLGTAMFEGNMSLEKVNMSGLVITDSESDLFIDPSCFDNCPALIEMHLPRLTGFGAAGMAGYPNLGVNPAIRRLVIGAFYCGGQPAIVYNETARTSPSIFVKTTGAPMKTWPMSQFIFISGGSQVRPVLFCEAYGLNDPDSGDVSEYVLSGATYYIPGGTRNNYSDALRAGCQVMEMFDMSYGDEGGTFNVGVHSLIGDGEDGIEFIRLNINNEWSCEPGADGRFVTTYSPGDVDFYELEYNCRGIGFKTRYPKPNLSAIETVGDVRMSFRDGVLSLGDTEADYRVADISGVTVAEGRGTTARLSGLERGVYVVTVLFDNGRTMTKTIRL